MSLIEPDAVHQAFDGTVEISVFKNDEWRFATQFQGEAFVTGRGSATDGATDLGRAGHGELSDIRVLDQSLARGTVAGNDVDHARRQSDFLADFGKGEGG